MPQATPKAGAAAGNRFAPTRLPSPPFVQDVWLQGAAAAAAPCREHAAHDLAGRCCSDPPQWARSDSAKHLAVNSQVRQTSPVTGADQHRRCGCLVVPHQVS